MSLKAALARVHAALRRRGTSAQDADDLVQEAWMRLACYQRDQVVAQPEAFVMRAALNLAIDAHRMRVNHGEEVLVEQVILFDTAPGIEAQVLARERLTRLSECLARLSDRTRTIFLSHRVDGATYEEIARLHGLSISAVHKHIAKATLQLTTWMDGW